MTLMTSNMEVTLHRGDLCLINSGALHCFATVETAVALGDIAQSASVSRQECMRCFRKYVHASPISFLTEYRIRMAAEQLLHTDSSILAISENCGFSSAGYFTKVFKSVMKCTPKEYRRMQQ